MKVCKAYKHCFCKNIEIGFLEEFRVNIIMIEPQILNLKNRVFVVSGNFSKKFNFCDVLKTKSSILKLTKNLLVIKDQLQIL